MNEDMLYEYDLLLLFTDGGINFPPRTRDIEELGGKYDFDGITFLPMDGKRETTGETDVT